MIAYTYGVVKACWDYSSVKECEQYIMPRKARIQGILGIDMISESYFFTSKK